MPISSRLARVQLEQKTYTSHLGRGKLHLLLSPQCCRPSYDSPESEISPMEEQLDASSNELIDERGTFAKSGHGTLLAFVL
mmetsp:Transcript_870/g.1382  ORF Transcript_870/g.1382 Transcript_870/m.1382 type:complete len:81 (-) Transcript_870:369-611(-)